MKNLKVYINRIPIPTKNSKWTNLLVFGIILVFVVLLLPVVLITAIYSFFDNLGSKKKQWDPYEWHTEVKNEFVEIMWKYWETDKLPNVLKDQLEENNIGEYNSSKNVDFFKGFFTDFRVDRTDGIFVQKIELSSDNSSISRMPLYFYDYETDLTKEIQDLNGYSLDTKGKPDDFMITGYGKDEELQITLKK